MMKNKCMVFAFQSDTAGVYVSELPARQIHLQTLHLLKAKIYGPVADCIMPQVVDKNSQIVLKIAIYGIAPKYIRHGDDVSIHHDCSPSADAGKSK